MSDSDKIAIANIVISTLVSATGWLVAWRIAKNTSQTRLPVDKPTATPNKKKLQRKPLNERAIVRSARIIQWCAVGSMIIELYIYVRYGTSVIETEPTSWSLPFVLMNIMVSGTLIAFLERDLVRPIKAGTFARDRRLRALRKRKAVKKR